MSAAISTGCNPICLMDSEQEYLEDSSLFDMDGKQELIHIRHQDDNSQQNDSRQERDCNSGRVSKLDERELENNLKWKDVSTQQNTSSRQGRSIESKDQKKILERSKIPFLKFRSKLSRVLRRRTGAQKDNETNVKEFDKTNDKNVALRKNENNAKNFDKTKNNNLALRKDDTQTIISSCDSKTYNKKETSSTVFEGNNKNELTFGKDKLQSTAASVCSFISEKSIEEDHNSSSNEDQSCITSINFDNLISANPSQEDSLSQKIEYFSPTSALQIAISHTCSSAVNDQSLTSFDTWTATSVDRKDTDKPKEAEPNKVNLEIPPNKLDLTLNSIETEQGKDKISLHIQNHQGKKKPPAHRHTSNIQCIPKSDSFPSLTKIIPDPSLKSLQTKMYGGIDEVLKISDGCSQNIDIAASTQTVLQNSKELKSACHCAESSTFPTLTKMAQHLRSKPLFNYFDSGIEVFSHENNNNVESTEGMKKEISILNNFFINLDFGALAYKGAQDSKVSKENINSSESAEKVETVKATEKQRRSLTSEERKREVKTKIRAWLKTVDIFCDTFPCTSTLPRPNENISYGVKENLDYDPPYLNQAFMDEFLKSVDHCVDGSFDQLVKIKYNENDSFASQSEQSFVENRSLSLEKSKSFDHILSTHSRKKKKENGFSSCRKGRTVSHQASDNNQTSNKKNNRKVSSQTLQTCDSSFDQRSDQSFSSVTYTLASDDSPKSSIKNVISISKSRTLPPSICSDHGYYTSDQTCTSYIHKKKRNVSFGKNNKKTFPQKNRRSGFQKPIHSRLTRDHHSNYGINNTFLDDYKDNQSFISNNSQSNCFQGSPRDQFSSHAYQNNPIDDHGHDQSCSPSRNSHRKSNTGKTCTKGSMHALENLDSFPQETSNPSSILTSGHVDEDDSYKSCTSNKSSIRSQKKDFCRLRSSVGSREELRSDQVSLPSTRSNASKKSDRRSASSSEINSVKNNFSCGGISLPSTRSNRSKKSDRSSASSSETNSAKNGFSSDQVSPFSTRSNASQKIIRISSSSSKTEIKKEDYDSVLASTLASRIKGRIDTWSKDKNHRQCMLNEQINSEENEMLRQLLKGIGVEELSKELNQPAPGTKCQEPKLRTRSHSPNQLSSRLSIRSQSPLTRVLPTEKKNKVLSSGAKLSYSGKEKNINLNEEPTAKNDLRLTLEPHRSRKSRKDASVATDEAIYLKDPPKLFRKIRSNQPFVMTRAEYRSTAKHPYHVSETLPATADQILMDLQHQKQAVTRKGKDDNFMEIKRN